ncbi:MAG: 4Fe-4S binding protein [Candidatus Thorarchaeota archaeon]|jgi:epoxyqueuosine reductase QueG
MDSIDLLKMNVQEKAIKWGADIIGFAPVDRFENHSAEHHPQTMLDTAKTVIVIGINMVDPSLDLWLHPEVWKAKGKPSRAFEDEILRGIAYRIALFIERTGYKAEVVPYEPSLYLKEAGHYAGLGVFGKNNLLLTPDFGPNIRLRALVTDVQFDPDPIDNEDRCKDCTLCIQACPADALAQVYDKEKCLRYCESHLEHFTGVAVLWCIRCIEACPYSKGQFNLT